MEPRDEHRSGPLVLAGIAIAGAAALAVAMLCGFRDPLVPFLWLLVLGALVFAAVAHVLGRVKRRAAEVAQLTGVPAFAARLELTGSDSRTADSSLRGAIDTLGTLQNASDQLSPADGYAAPFHPILCTRDGVLELWRSAGHGAPYATVPVHLITARLDPGRRMLQAAALQLHVDGLRLPLVLSFYRSGWAAVLPAGALDLESIASELGLRFVDSDADRV